MNIFKTLKNRFLYQKLTKQSFSTTNEVHVYKKHFIYNPVEVLFIKTRDYPGSLKYLLEIFQQNRINLSYIESKKLNIKGKHQDVLFIISFKGQQNDQAVKQAFIDLEQRFDNVWFSDQLPKVPWYPRTLEEVKYIGNQLMVVKEENNKDHPQFSDEVYRKRRNFIANYTKDYVFGEKIPILKYTDQENQTWRYIYEKLDPFHEKICTESYLKYKRELESTLMINKQIPQLCDLDSYLQSKTNFRIKPAAGILSQREFLNALAHRVFFSTQYIRHHATPEYTPEPDIVHEVLGHIPMFCDPLVADISHEIGLLSLGASPTQLKKLGNLYWFTLEFGACYEKGKIKGFGAGIASSIGESKHFLGEKAKFELLNPIIDCDKTYPIQNVQPVYKYSYTLQELLDKVIKFGESIKKPMQTYYDFNNNTVEADKKFEAIFVEEEMPEY
ncbi:hypothetical protein IMG5_057970 [Ichthyophthirius multifiliis]|uniref:phenylalanine 4-monooxygenase n=1 Tax=Ichthyophthirius multifiliis TaxID=5932 RepID=G0QNF3_ICHMU|nr:hypothetical protein IMG5_057970 [Ichthyophthirius multifiliis]EGR33242.1 hypothetical protein IMG5_057970 [Ichthyophthirius multifiliis]|eukprot:XP_004037228.1 hypothetical protein IMG5_057970 [Ichthyophthirius multifiliis]